LQLVVYWRFAFRALLFGFREVHLLQFTALLAVCLQHPTFDPWPAVCLQHPTVEPCRQYACSITEHSCAGSLAV
jgi:hypothetical protein